MRERRAARSPQTKHNCPTCGISFMPKRTDAAFCSVKCRSFYWQRICHEALTFHADSPHTCKHGLMETGKACGAPAPWFWQWCHNHARHLGYEAWRCAEHRPQHVEPGKTLQQILGATRHTRRAPRTLED